MIINLVASNSFLITHSSSLIKKSAPSLEHFYNFKYGPNHCTVLCHGHDSNLFFLSALSFPALLLPFLAGFPCRMPSGWISPAYGVPHLLHLVQCSQSRLRSEEYGWLSLTRSFGSLVSQLGLSHR